MIFLRRYTIPATPANSLPSNSPHPVLLITPDNGILYAGGGAPRKFRVGARTIFDVRLFC